jgi:glycolate oxidase FAD binding subunit
MLAREATTETPASADEVAALIADAGAAGRKVEIVGGGTKRALGGGRGDLALSTAKLARVVDYQPDELVLTAQPGVRLSQLEKLVASEGQVLAFEPPRWTKLLGVKGEPTLGGALAANLSGPRRIRAGAARDHFLGFEAVLGRGERFKAGGKVVKNVTGYDLMKLMAGSWGTLAVLTEVTIKVLPAPKAEVTLMLFGLADAPAAEAMTVAMNGPFEVSGAAHLPAFAAARPPLKAEMPVTALRLEGFEASVAARVESLAAALKGYGRPERLEGAMSRGFWLQVREADALAKDPRPLWRLSLPPADGWRAAQALGGETLYDWAGGLVWLLSDADPAAVRAKARALSGHALCLRGASAFGTLEPALAALNARVKAAFDPLGVLNPGRFAA